MMECARCKTPLPDSARFCLTCGFDVSGNPMEHTIAESDPALLTKLQDELGKDFLIERELGRGGMAVVFLAEDVHIGRKVAVKVLPPELTYGHGAGFVDRFKREARTAGTLEHPNIIPIHRVSTEGKLFWYIMKYINGEGLDQVLKREGQLSLRKTADILVPAADALDYAHKRGVIHRDIKPGNLLLDAEGKVTITDFGIAKALIGNSLTVSGSILGTPYYMSPEQCAGKTLTGAADQYSVAVMAYQMLAGHLPFAGESAVEIIKKHTLDPVPPIAVLRPGIPVETAAAIERALAKTPEERFATVKDFVRAIEVPQEESSAPLTASKAETLRPHIQVSAELMPTQATPTTMFRPTLKVRLAPMRARVAELVEQLEPLRARAVVLVRRAEIIWKGLSRRTQVISATAGGVVLLAAVLLAWPSGDKQAADSGPQTADGSPATTLDRGPQTANRGSTGGTLLKLRVNPAGAAITVDGATVTRADSVTLAPGRHVLAATKEGYRAWTDSIVASDTGVIARTVALVALPARVSLSTSVPATLTINSKSAANPVRELEVPAGQVRVHFQVRDTDGTWEADSVLTVKPGTLLQKRFQLATSARAARRARPPRVPATITTQVLTVPAPGAAAALAEGYATTDMDLLSPRCGRFIELFWDVMGYDVDVARLCAASAVLVVKGNTPERLLNFTRFARTRDGAIETVERPSAVAEWRNEVSGKRLRFRLGADKIVVTDETPAVPVVRASTRKAQRSVTVRKSTEGGAPVSIVRIDAFGLSVKTPRDSLPVAASASHGHRIGSCSGRLTFDGERFRYVPDKGDHKFSFAVADVLDGTASADRGALRFKIGTGSERLIVREWESVFEAAIVARLP